MNIVILKNDFFRQKQKEKKRKYEEYWNPKYQYSTEEENKNEYHPKKGGLIYRNTLNLDCITNREEILQEWLNELALILLNEFEATKLVSKDIIRIAIFKTTGNVRAFLQTVNPSILTRSDAWEILDSFGKILAQEFLGKDLVNNEIKEK